MTGGKTIFRTWSVCPVCLKTIRAERIAAEGNIFLQKTCPEHGEFKSMIWRGYLDFNSWVNGSDPVITEQPGCPDECGLCDNHLQKTCCIMLNVTERCNLDCRFCLDGRNNITGEPSASEIRNWLSNIIVPGKTLVQLSGGEPTMRDDLPEIIKYAKELGAKYVQLNSNGIRLGEDPAYTEKLAKAGLSFVFMQFDGTRDQVYEVLRGRPLLEIKLKAIAVCAANNIGVTLVPTVVRDINLNDLGNIIRFAVSESPSVRGVHFQPVSFFGKIPHNPSDKDRITLDELIYEVERQSEGLINSGDLLPSCCDHPLCGFHGDFVADNGRLLPLTKKQEKGNGSCCDPLAAEKNREFVARRWQRPDKQGETESSTGDIRDMDYFLERVKTHGFTVTSMTFQDAWNLDISRLRKCSLHVYDNGRIVPFCSHYLTGVQE